MFIDGIINPYKVKIFAAITIGVVTNLLVLYHVNKMDKKSKILMFAEPKNNSDKSEMELYLSDSSICKTMFTIDSGNNNLKSRYYSIAKEIHHLEKARQGRSVSYSGALNNLGRYLPKIYLVNFKDPVDIHQAKLTTNVNKIHYTQWPYVPCEAHKYSTKDVKTCSYLYQNKTSKPLRISFVGDSMIRSVMKRMVLFLKNDLQLRYLNDERHVDIRKDFEETNFKSNVTVIGEGIELRFYWASFLDRNRNISDETQQGANDLLQNWVDGKHLSQSPLPDILYIGSGAWLSFHRSSDVAIEEFLYMIKQVFSKLRILSLNTRVLWHVHPTPGPGNRNHLYVLKQDPSVLSWMNQAAFLTLKRSNIWFWDTLAVLSSREKKECAAYQTIKHLLPSSWNCYDLIHPGAASGSGGVNMMFNLACNRILNFKKKCCT